MTKLKLLILTNSNTSTRIRENLYYSSIMELMNAADVVLICVLHLVPLISKESQRIINAYKSRGVTAVVNLSQRYSRAFIINPPIVHIKKINRVEGPRILKRSSCLFVPDLMPGWSGMRQTFWDDLHLEFESCSLKKGKAWFSLSDCSHWFRIDRYICLCTCCDFRPLLWISVVLRK